MGIVAIIAALLLEQWRPLAERTAVAAALGGFAGWLERSFNAGEARHGAIAWLVAVVPALYLPLGFRQFSHSFTAIQAAIREGELERAQSLISGWRGEPGVLRSREEVIRLAIEEALIASHRHVFGVLLWYVVLPGPSGAILYRLPPVPGPARADPGP